MDKNDDSKPIIPGSDEDMARGTPKLRCRQKDLGRLEITPSGHGNDQGVCWTTSQFVGCKFTGKFTNTDDGSTGQIDD